MGAAFTSTYGSNEECEDSDEEEENGDPTNVEMTQELTEEEILGNHRRLQRAENQVMRIMSAKKKRGIFSIKSAEKTGVYIVRIKSIPTCTCRDFEKGWICKHLKAILLNVYKVDERSPLLNKRVFARGDLESFDINVNLCEQELDEHDIGSIMNVGF